MAPSLINKKSDTQTSKELNKYNKIKKKISEYQKFIKNNFEYVWVIILLMKQDQYITMKKKKKKVFMAQHQNKTLKNLKKKGIDTQTIPWVEDKNN